MNTFMKVDLDIDKEAKSHWSFKSLLMGLVLMITAGSLYAIPAHAQTNPSDWPTYNADALGTRSSSSDSAPTPSQIKQKGLEVKWSFQTPGGVTATPAVVGGVIYAGDTSGNFYALDRNGNLLWSQSGFTRITSSALVVNNRVIVGTNTVHAFVPTDVIPGEIIAFYRTPENGHAAGDIAYKITATQLNRTNPFTSFFGSPMLAKGAIKGKDVVVIGINSDEEYATRNPDYLCCTSRGGVAAFDPNTGQIAWISDFVKLEDQGPQPGFNEYGPSGASVWTTPTYDDNSKLIYVATGNNFSRPTTETSDAIIALNAKDGSIAWINQLTPNDHWNFRFPTDEQTPDADFGDSVNIFSLANGTRVVAAAQKSGFVHLLDAKTGNLLSQFQVVPFGTLGGLFADSAYAKGVLFVNGVTQYCSVADTGLVCNDSFHSFFTDIAKSGTVAAIDVRTSNISELWKFETPDFLFNVTLSGLAHAKGVIYAAETDILGTRDKLWVLDAKTGVPLTNIALPSGSISGPSISGNRIYVGSGIDELGYVPGSIISIGVK